jgi:putative ABC transport system permease protein
MNADLGFRPAQQITMELPVSRGKLAGAGEAEAFYRTLLERVQAIPGVTGASLSTGIPVSGLRFGSDVRIEGRPDEPGRGAGGGVNMVTPGYFTVFGLTLRQGRAFDDRDRAGSVPVMTVNETFARAFFPDGNAVGRRVLLAPFATGPGPRGAPVAWEIVGVHADVANNGPGGRAIPEMLVPFWQLPVARTIVTVKTSGGAAAVVSAIGDAARTLDPTLPVTRVRTIEQVLSASVASDRFYTVFFAAFALVALTLAAVGIYGVMSFAVAQRTHEIGLRMALGARRAQVLAQVLREGMATALAGTVLGVAGAALVGRTLKGAIYGVDAGNPLTFAAVAALLLLAALIACVVPARRAATVDPLVALRQE